MCQAQHFFPFIDEEPGTDCYYTKGQRLSGRSGICMQVFNFRVLSGWSFIEHEVLN